MTFLTGKMRRCVFFFKQKFNNLYMGETQEN